MSQAHSFVLQQATTQQANALMSRVGSWRSSPSRRILMRASASTRPCDRGADQQPQYRFHQRYSPRAAALHHQFLCQSLALCRDHHTPGARRLPAGSRLYPLPGGSHPGDRPDGRGHGAGGDSGGGGVGARDDERVCCCPRPAGWRSCWAKWEQRS